MADVEEAPPPAGAALVAFDSKNPSRKEFTLTMARLATGLKGQSAKVQ
jgi:hypothetical protein